MRELQDKEKEKRKKKICPVLLALSKEEVTSKKSKEEIDSKGYKWPLESINCKDIFSFEIKRHWLLRRKVVTDLDSVVKSRDVTLPTTVHMVTAMIFPIVMYWCGSWTVQKDERRRIDTLELWCWRRLLRALGLQGDQTSQS